MRKLRFSHAAIGRLIIGLALVVIALYVNWSQLPSIRAEEGNRAGLVIQYEDGRVETQCINFTEEEISGYDLLAASRFESNIDANNSMGVVICGIDGEGCSFPQDQCFCQCTSVPCTYWNYWKQESGEWVHSGFGASNSAVKDGGVDAWSWSQVGTIEDEPESKPPLMTFDEICNPYVAPTETAIAAATMTAEAPTEIPTSTPTETATSPPATPTPTVTPTLTNTPIPPPVISVLRADREEITAGESVVISWETSGAESVLLRKPDDSELGLGATGTMTLNPNETSTYSVIARNSGGEDKVSITITVLPADAQNPQPTATASGGESPPETPTATAATGESPSLTPTAQQTQPVAMTATSTAIVISAPPATSTPAQQTAAVIVIDAPPSTSTATPIVSVAESAADLNAATPVPTPSDTPTPAPPTVTPSPTDTPTIVIASNDIPDASAPLDSESTEVIVVDNVDAPETDNSVADEPQLANIFAGMIFVMAVPLILGLAWMGLRTMGSRRQ